MFGKIRITFTRTRNNPAPTYTPEDLERIGAALRASRERLAQLRELPIEDLDTLYRRPDGS